ncbi:MAG: hypothetical protein GXO01_03695 [Epsilonproteobacteria bacterium]|nr:hypothetical protein [Campylobacterota bacterium]
MKKLLLYILLMVFSFAAEHEFTLTKSYNIHGNYKFIGNAVLEVNTNYNYEGWVQSLDGDWGYNVNNGQVEYLLVNNWWTYVGDLKVNNFNFLKYIDVDNDNTTYDSSSSDLTIPAGSKIIYARLYWTGFIYDDSDDIQKAKEAKIKINDGDYVDVNVDTQGFSDTEGFDYVSWDSQFIRYISYKDVTNLFDNMTFDGNPINITVANVNAVQGWHRGLGTHGAWSLVVVYKNANETFKNISIFTGYKSVFDNTVNINISGFYTPPSGDVKSNISVFATEGDKGVFGNDYLKVANKDGNLIDVTNNTSYPNAKDDIFDSTITTNEQRNPDIQNNMGIDIDTFPIGVDGDTNHPQIIGNSQTSTTIQASSGGDAYMLDTIIFSTDLYVPKVCYDNLEFYDENGNLLNAGSTVPVGSEIMVSFDVKNMDNEIAKNVFVRNVFDDNVTSYVENSTDVKNIGASSFLHLDDGETIDNLGVYYFDENKTWSVGILGDDNNAFLPTTTNPNYVATIHFKAKIENEGNITYNFLTNYIYTIGNNEYTYDDILPKCEDFDNGLSSYTPVAGSFNVVEPTFTGDFDPLDVNNTLNEIHTKIVSKPFDMKVIKLDSTKEYLEKFKGLVKVDIIKDPTDNDECKNNEALWTNYILFNNSSSTDIDDINMSQAVKKARFRIVYLTDGNGNIVEDTNNACLDKTYNCVWGLLTQIATSRYGNSCPTGDLKDSEYCDVPCAVECNYRRNRVQGGGDVPSEECLKCIFGAYGESVCSRDDFSVRPDRFKITPNTTGKLKAGKVYTFTIEALDADGNAAKGYDEKLSLVNKSPLLEYNDTKASLGCQRGVLSLADINSAQFTDGVANVKLTYSEVGDLNMTLKELNGNEFAKVDEKDGANPNGIYITEAQKTVTYIPDHFSLTTPSYLDGGNGFTYMSNDLNMSSVLSFTVKAENANNVLTKNYKNGCYAKDLSVTVTHSTVPVTEQIIYKEENETGIHNIANTQNIVFTAVKEKFADGIGNVKAYINFVKNYSSPENPFTMTLNHLNVLDSDGVSGNNVVNQTANFIYGRIVIPNIASYSNVIHNTIKYEYYKNGNWYVNGNHTSNAFGDINVTKSILPNVSAVAGTINGGYQDLKYVTSHPLPYSVKAHYAISSWLWYHPKATIYLDPSATNLNCLTHPCNKIDFLAVAGGWAGIGDNNSTYAPENNRTVKAKSSADVNASKSQVRTINW